MKFAALSASALLTALPSAAFADSAKYTAIYSPTLDIATRSCEIVNTGVKGDLALNTISGTVDGLGSDNTSIMRTIGNSAGTASSKAGIRFNMVGANVITIENAEMYSGENQVVGNGGKIELDLPNAKVDISRQDAETIGISSSKGNTIAKVVFQSGRPNTDGRLSSGSVVVGKKTNAQRIGTEGFKNLVASRVTGDRSGVVKFTLNDIDESTPTIAISADITCSPIPVATTSPASLRPVR